MYSLSYLYQAMGDNNFADRCECTAFNALPVMFTDDLWTHQYLVVANQPIAYSLNGPNSFWNTGDQSILYGACTLNDNSNKHYLLIMHPAPNYPCCTVNMPQGLPKFLSASFVRVGPNGLGHALLAPARVSTTLASGAHVDLTCNTTYPFSNALHYTFTTSAPFSLNLRLPSWATSYQIQASSDRLAAQKYSSSSLLPDPHTGMLSINLFGSGTVDYSFSTAIRTEDRGNDTISIYHGALLYALDVGFSDTTTANISSSTADNLAQNATSPIPYQAHDHYITNTKPWNIAIDPSTLIYHTTTSSSDSNGNETLPNPIWAYGAPPGYIIAKGCEIEWGVEKQLPAPPPGKAERACKGEAKEVVLRPYGSLKVHMAVLPTVDLS